ncbi:MAG: hypothetical protein J6B85_08385 [Lachnospiraceae bacterium]|nr:hypothetical protein [Lachnospiraceae bacterium]
MSKKILERAGKALINYAGGKSGGKERARPMQMKRLQESNKIDIMNTGSDIADECRGEKMTGGE